VRILVVDGMLDAMNLSRKRINSSTGAIEAGTYPSEKKETVSLKLGTGALFIKLINNEKPIEEEID
jgi:hypothetical protein